MRRLLAIAAIAASIASCTNAPAPSSEIGAMAHAPDTLKYPYKALYSSSFSIGNNADSKIILDIWKAYEDGRLQDTKDMWADTVTMEFSGGYKLHASRDSLMA